MMSNKTIVLTGIRSNGPPTLGNYLGAILPLIRLQKKRQYQVNLFLPDLHSIISSVEYNELYNNTLSTLRYFVAAGLDLNDQSTFIYRQSYIPAHSELTWILDCFSYYGELKRMTQFKEKSTHDDNISVGIFNYPALMASDILLYDAEFIPVGEDQRQHLELTRDIALRINNQFGDLFTIPKTWKEQLQFENLQNGIRIRSLKHPENKMSKSISDPSGTILLMDDVNTAKKKVYEATTDSYNKIDFNFDTQPGISNLLQILTLIQDRPLNETILEWRGKSNYGELKQCVANQIEILLNEVGNKFNSITDDSLTETLLRGESAMNVVANQKLYKVQQKVGLRPISS